MKCTVLKTVVMVVMVSSMTLDVEARDSSRSNRSRSAAARSSGGLSQARMQSRTRQTSPTQTRMQSRTRQVSPTQARLQSRRPQLSPTQGRIQNRTQPRASQPTFGKKPSVFNRPQVSNSAPRPRNPLPKPLDPGIGNGRPSRGPVFQPHGGVFGKRPTQVSPTQGRIQGRNPLPKPLDPGIGNGRPSRGPVFNPHGGVFGKRPAQVSPTDGRIQGRKPLPRPGVGAPAPRPRPTQPKPGTGAPAPRPGNVIGAKPKPGIGAPAPRPRPTRPKPGTGAPKPRPGNVIGAKPKPGMGAPAPRPRPTRPKPGTGAPKPRPGTGTPITVPAHGHGNHHGHHGHHGHHKPWHVKPRHCWWWFDYCKPVGHYRPADYYACDYIYTTCRYVGVGGVVVEDARWYLGIKGIMLPGKGIGIEAVEANSPAALTGLKSGMVITKVNGLVIVDEATFGEALAASGGVLKMQLLSQADGDLLEATVKMTRLVKLSY